jgi:hypothetical protein
LTPFTAPTRIHAPALLPHDQQAGHRTRHPTAARDAAAFTEI